MDVIQVTFGLRETDIILTTRILFACQFHGRHCMLGQENRIRTQAYALHVLLQYYVKVQNLVSHTSYRGLTIFT